MNYCMILLAGILAGITVNMFSDAKEPAVNKLKHPGQYIYKDKYCVIVNMAMPLLFLYTYLKLGINFEGVKGMVFVTLLVGAVLSDIRKREIPNRLIAVFLAAGIAFSVISLDLNVVLNAVIAFLLFGVVFLVISKITKGGVGEGDVKLIACSGLFLGISGLFSSVFMALMLTCAASIALLILRLANRKSFLPFAPFFLAGFVISIL